MRWLVLAMRCALIALIAAAFARPFFQHQAGGDARGVVIAVDNSFSMQSTGRWEALKTWSLSQARDLKKGDQLGILLMHPVPHWLIPLSDDLETGRNALTNLRPGWETTHYQEALQLASETLRVLPFRYREIIWMADEQRLGWQNVKLPGGLPAGIEVNLPTAVEAPKRQAAVSAFSLRPLSDGTMASVTVESFDPGKQSRTITISANGQALANQTVDLEAGKSLRVDIPFENPDAATAFRVDLDPDDLRADDTAYASMQMRGGVPAYLSPLADSGAADFMEYALRATVLQKLDAVRVETLPETDAWPTDGVVVVRGGASLIGAGAGRLTDYLKGGGAAWMVVDGSPEQTAWLAQNGVTVTPRPQNSESRLRNLDVEHPLFSPFVDGQLGPLLSLPFRAASTLEGASLFPIADWNDGTTAIAEVSIGSGRLLLTGFDIRPRTNALPLSPAFVPLVHRAISWLSQKQNQADQYQVGDLIPLGTQDGMWTVLDSPEVLDPLKVSGSIQAAAPGLFLFKSGTTEEVISVNLDPEESNLTTDLEARDRIIGAEIASTPEGVVEATRTMIQLSSESSEQQVAIWWWLLAIAALLLLAELALSNRTAL